MLLGPSLTIFEIPFSHPTRNSANATLGNSSERCYICIFTWISLWCLCNNAYQGRIFFKSWNFAKLTSETFSLELLLREFRIYRSAVWTILHRGLLVGTMHCNEWPWSSCIERMQKYLFPPRELRERIILSPKRCWVNTTPISAKQSEVSLSDFAANDTLYSRATIFALCPKRIWSFCSMVTSSSIRSCSPRTRNLFK